MPCHIHLFAEWRVVRDVSEAVVRRKGQVMKFPTSYKAIVTTIQKQFFQYCRFPGVAVDGTHVYIRSPGGARARYYFNRKNRYSIDVQVRINEYIMTGSSTAFPLDLFFVPCKIFTLDIYTLQSCVLYIHANSLVTNARFLVAKWILK